MTVVKKIHVYEPRFQPIGYSDWLDFWQKNNAFRFERQKCAVQNCYGKAVVALPVHLVGYRVPEIYIVPFCDSCSSLSFNSMINIVPHFAILAPKNLASNE